MTDKRLENLINKNLENLIMRMYEQEFTHHEIAEEVVSLVEYSFDKAIDKVTSVILKNQKMPVGK